MKIMQIMDAGKWHAVLKRDGKHTCVKLACWALVDLAGCRRVYGMIPGEKGLEVVGPKMANNWSQENPEFIKYMEIPC